MAGWINFFSLLGNIVLFCGFYLLSVQPMKREAKRGKRAWRECTVFRSIAGVFEFLILVNTVLWTWFPISLFNWKVHLDSWVGIGISLGIAIPGLTILLKAVYDAGSETLHPSPETTMYKGIYQYIRHPQILGAFPLFIAGGFFVNSWFLVFVLLVFVISYVPIMIYYEEQDLIRRFGTTYHEYQKNTGALFPKLR